MTVLTASTEGGCASEVWTSTQLSSESASGMALSCRQSCALPPDTLDSSTSKDWSLDAEVRIKALPKAKSSKSRPLISGCDLLGSTEFSDVGVNFGRVFFFLGVCAAACSGGGADATSSEISELTAGKRSKPALSSSSSISELDEGLALQSIPVALDDT